jgi:hypothetical protein
VTAPGRLAALRTALAMAMLQARHRRCPGYREVTTADLAGWACFTHGAGDGLVLASVRAVVAELDDDRGTS